MFEERVAQRTLFQAVMREAPKPPHHAGHRSGVLNANRQRLALVGQQMLQAYDPHAAVGWRTFLVPSELFYATGVLPFTPESACAVLSRNQDAIQRTVAHAEEAGYHLKQCSFLKTIIGGTRDGLLPVPDIVVGSSCFCSGITSVLNDAARHFNRPFFHLDLPLYSDASSAVEDVSRQLRELTRLLCGTSGVGLEEVERERLPLAIERANRAARCWKEIEDLRKTVPSPLAGREALDFATVLSQHWGSEAIVRIYETLRDEVRQRIADGVAAVPNELVRLYWLHLRPYYSDDIMRWIEDAGGAVVFEEVNYPGRLPMDPEDPYRSLARETLCNAGRYRAFTDEMLAILRYVVREFRIDGVIHFGHDNCAWSEAVLPPQYRFIRDELRLPVVSIDGDCLIRGRDNLMRTRVLSFVENLIARKHGAARATPSRSRPPVAVNGAGDWSVGIDVGSATIKVAVLDSERRIRSTAVLPTGGNNRRIIMLAVGRALERIDGRPAPGDCRIVATGVGGATVPFPHAEITEIACHTRGVLQLLPEAQTIIDIGGQDTKVILVALAISKMNTACAAGTGKFLDVIARAMGLDLIEMNALDEAADGAAPVSRMCTVFAESEVVNRIASGVDVGRIARGVHEMVAGKAATLVRQLARELPLPVVFTGGVAQNAAVVRALERQLGCRIYVPSIPQLTGALGAAAFAFERSGLVLDAQSPVAE